MGLVPYNICMVSLFTATARVTRARFARNFTRHLREKRRALLFTVVRIATRGKKTELSSKIYPDFPAIVLPDKRKIFRLAIIKALTWKGRVLKLKKLASERMRCLPT